ASHSGHAADALPGDILNPMTSTKSLGVLGGGQLGRMLGLAGIPLGVRCRFLEPEQTPPAASAGEHLCARFDDAAALERFASGLGAVTYEFENVPLATAESLARRLPVWPPPAALAASQERLAEKQFFERLGVPTAAFAPANNRDEF